MPVTRDEVRRLLVEEHGWTEDRFGHLRKTVTTNEVRVGDDVVTPYSVREYRFKLSKVMARREVQVVHHDGSKSWIRIKSGYYKDLRIIDGKIHGMKR